MSDRNHPDESADERRRALAERRRRAYSERAAERASDEEQQVVAEEDEAAVSERLRTLEALSELARLRAPSLVGLTVAQAQELVDQHPGLSVDFKDADRLYLPVGVFGQISAFVADGIVVEAY